MPIHGFKVCMIIALLVAGAPVQAQLCRPNLEMEARLERIKYKTDSSKASQPEGNGVSSAVRPGFRLVIARSESFTVQSFLLQVETDDGDILEVNNTGDVLHPSGVLAIQMRRNKPIYIDCIKVKHNASGAVNTLKPITVDPGSL